METNHEWEEDFDYGHLKSFISSIRQQAYEAGRQAMVEEILAELTPQKLLDIDLYGTDMGIVGSHNKCLSAIRDLIEKKLSN